MGKEQLWLLINPQEQGREAPKQREPTLQGPPVDYSGKDKLPGASIHSQQPLRGLPTPEEFWFQKGRKGPHKGRQWVAWTREIKNHKDIDAVLAFSTLSLNNKPLRTCATRFPWKSHSAFLFTCAGEANLPMLQMWKCYLLPSGF